MTENRRVRLEKSEVLKLQASYQKAKRLIGWEPKVSLDEGLRKIIDWISRHLDRYQPDEYTV